MNCFCEPFAAVILTCSSVVLDFTQTSTKAGVVFVSQLRGSFLVCVCVKQVQGGQPQHFFFSANAAKPLRSVEAIDDDDESSNGNDDIKVIHKSCPANWDQCDLKTQNFQHIHCFLLAAPNILLMTSPSIRQGNSNRSSGVLENCSQSGHSLKQQKSLKTPILPFCPGCWPIIG